MRKILTATAGLVLGTGVAIMAVAGPAAAQPAAGSACQQLESTLSSIQSTLPSAASSPGALKTKIGTFASQLQQQAASAPPAVRTAVGSFVADLQAAASGKVNVAKLTSDANAIGTACRAQATPGGAPGTGGGSTTGVRDPVLFGAGGAAVLAGLGAVGLARRNRPHSSTRHG